MDGPWLNQDDCDKSTVKPFVETTLNQYLESNHISFDESVSSNSISILASPLLSDYISSRNTWGSPSENIHVSHSCVEQERDEDDDEVRNSLSSLQIASSEDEEESIILHVMKETEDGSLSSSPSSSSSPSNDFSRLVNVTENCEEIVQESLDEGNQFISTYHSDTSSLLPKNPSLDENNMMIIENPQSNASSKSYSPLNYLVEASSTVRQEKFNEHADCNFNILASYDEIRRLSIERHLSDIGQKEIQIISHHTPSLRTTAIQSIRKTASTASLEKENIQYSFGASEEMIPGVKTFHKMIVESPEGMEPGDNYENLGPQEDELLSENNSPFSRANQSIRKTAPIAALEKENMLSPPLSRLSNDRINVQYSLGASERVNHETIKSPGVKPFHKMIVESSVGMEPGDNYENQGPQEDELLSENNSPFSRANQSIRKTTPIAALEKENMLSPPLSRLSNDRIKVQYSLGASERVNHETIKSPGVKPLNKMRVDSSVEIEPGDNYENQGPQEDELLAEDSPFSRKRINPSSSPYHSISTTSPFSIDETMYRLEFMASPSLSQNSTFNKSLILSSSKKLSRNLKSYDVRSQNDTFFSPSSSSDKDDFSSNYTPINDKRDSYLSLSHDLSSTKKHLNAHSTLFMKQLKGAFQRRTLHLAQSQNHSSSTAVVNVQSWGDWNEHISTITRDPLTIKKVTFSQDCKQGGSQTFKDMHETHDRMKANDEALNLRIHHRRALSSSSANVMLGKGNESLELYYTPFKARPLPASTMDPTGLSGVPKVSKLPVTIPISPQLGLRRKNTKLQGKKYDSKLVRNPGSTNRRTYQNTQNHFKSPDPLSHPKPSENFDTPSTQTRYLHGLEFLGATPNTLHYSNDVYVQGIENLKMNFQTSKECVYPFTLHSSVRAKNREEFEKRRFENELHTRRRRMALIESMIRRKQAELQILKPQL